MSRKALTSGEETRLLEANAYVCCVCKERGIGTNFHHIDHDPSNNDLSNIAVLCVKDHDAHHRPHRYTDVNHTELGVGRIRQYKEEWEAFVKEARKPHPGVLAVLNAYGTEEQIHSMRLAFQWKNGQVALERLYHLISCPPSEWADSVIDEVQWLGKDIKLTIIEQPLDIEYCPCCQSSLASTIDANFATKLTAADWDTNSICAIYINPDNASLSLTIGYANQELLSGSLHRCGETHLHLEAGKFQERVPIRSSQSVRTQATDIVHRLFETWSPGHIIIGTGDPDSPNIVDKLELPSVWE